MSDGNMLNSLYGVILDNIKSSDIQKVAKRVLDTPVSMAARGDIKLLPDIKDVQNALHSDGRLTNRKLSLFK